MTWHVLTNGQPDGPYTAAEIIDLVRHAKIPPDTMVAKEGTDQWVRLDNIPDLKPSRWTTGPVLAGLVLVALAVWFIWPRGPLKESTMTLNPDAQVVLLCTTKQTLEGLVDATAEKDVETIDAMISSGQARPVKPGSTVRILDAGFLASQVRILDGPDAGTQGWVLTEDLKSTPDL